MSKKCIIFDLDGTLTNTLTSIWYTLNTALTKVQLETIEREEYRYLVGNGVDVLIEAALEKVTNEPDKYFTKVKELYCKQFETTCMYEVVPYEGIMEVLKELKQRGILLAVNSNKQQACTEEVVKQIFKDDIFDCVVGQCEERKRKPAPDGVQYILQTLGVDKDEAIYIGDTMVDMQTGKSAGVLTIGALWGFRDLKELVSNGADAVIKHPMELLSYLDDEKIELIATDVDGTLVKDSSKEIPVEMVEVVKQAVQNGYHFIVASGRQYGSISKMFAPCECNLGYIAENGAHIVLNGETVASTKIDVTYVEQIMEDLRKFYGENCHVVASTTKGSYLESKDSEFIRLISEEYRNTVTLTDDILEHKNEIIKLALYKKDSILHIGESYLIPKWTGKSQSMYGWT